MSIKIDSKTLDDHEEDIEKELKDLALDKKRLAQLEKELENVARQLEAGNENV